MCCSLVAFVVHYLLELVSVSDMGCKSSYLLSSLSQNLFDFTFVTDTDRLVVVT